MECKETNCGNKAISLSEFCGDHTNNDVYLRAVIAELESRKTHKMCNISAVELEPEIRYEIVGKTISDGSFIDFNITNFSFVNCKFNNCEFSDLEIFECAFNDCTFNDCSLDQLSFSECVLINNTFEQCHWDNSSFLDDVKLNKNSFHLNKFSNLLITDGLNGKENIFEQCIFVLGSLNHSNFNDTQFFFTEFIKTSISYCSFRNSKFIDITHDFDEVGAPQLCDFFGSTVDHDVQILSEQNYCNFEHKNYLEFVKITINELLSSNDINLVTEISSLLFQLVDSGELISGYKDRVISFFKEQYAKDSSVEMIGTLISAYSQFPDEIIQSNFLLPSSSEGLSDNTARLVVTFDSDEMNFGTLVSINSVLAIVEHSLFGKDKDSLITKSIQSGSIIQEIIANTDKVVVFAGALYAFTKAIFSLVKNDAEIKKIIVETKKAELETQKLQRELDADVIKERTEKYIKVIRTEEITSVDIQFALEELLKSNDAIKHIQKLDKQFKIEKVEVIVKK